MPDRDRQTGYRDRRTGDRTDPTEETQPSQADTQLSANDDEAMEDEGPPPTPFDHPLFLPVLLFAGMLWFGFDGWLNSDPEMLEHRTFNRVGFAALTLLTLWFGRKGWSEFKQDRAARAGRDSTAADSEGGPSSP